MTERVWFRVDTGWYETDPAATDGPVVQRWWSAPGSPGNRAGWYAWKAATQECEWTWHRTMREAKVAALDVAELLTADIERLADAREAYDVLEDA